MQRELVNGLKIPLPWREGRGEGETAIRHEVSIIPPSPNLSRQGRGVV